MLTRAEGRRQRADIMKQIAREHRKTQREQLVQLRGEIRDAKAKRRLAVHDARNRCKTGRLAARARARELRVRLLAEMRAAVKAEKEQARASCSASLGEAKALGDRLARARAELLAERKFRADMRRIERGNRARAKELRSHTKRGQKQGESDDEVRGNIPPELVALFERVKSKVKGSARWSRTEAFLHYAEEHPKEVLEVLEDKTEQLIRELEQRERDTARAYRRPVPREVYESSGVPF
jgi:hypothetical protein